MHYHEVRNNGSRNEGVKFLEKVKWMKNKYYKITSENSLNYIPALPEIKNKQNKEILKLFNFKKIQLSPE